MLIELEDHRGWVGEGKLWGRPWPGWRNELSTPASGRGLPLETMFRRMGV